MWKNFSFVDGKDSMITRSESTYYSEIAKLCTNCMGITKTFELFLLSLYVTVLSPEVHTQNDNLAVWNRFLINDEALVRIKSSTVAWFYLITCVHVSKTVYDVY